VHARTVRAMPESMQRACRKRLDATFPGTDAVGASDCRRARVNSTQPPEARAARRVDLSRVR